jgi:glycosyltransferase involved in cell wall biosynthesis
LVQTYKRNISEDGMTDLYARSRFWLHPGQRVELFCISALKAQQSGCIPIVVPNMALAETVKTGIKTDLDHYFEELEKVLKNPPKGEFYEAPSWQEVTSYIVNLF